MLIESTHLLGRCVLFLVIWDKQLDSINRLKKRYLNCANILFRDNRETHLMAISWIIYLHLVSRQSLNSLGWITRTTQFLNVGRMKYLHMLCLDRYWELIAQQIEKEVKNLKIAQFLLLRQVKFKFMWAKVRIIAMSFHGNIMVAACTLLKINRMWLLMSYHQRSLLNKYQKLLKLVICILWVSQLCPIQMARKLAIFRKSSKLFLGWELRWQFLILRSKYIWSLTSHN